MRTRVFGLVLAAGVAGALAGCDRGATNNPNGPGTGNPTVQAAPATGDKPAEPANAVAGSSGPGGAAAGPDTAHQANGSGASSGSVPPGGGLQGGMGAGPAPGASGPAAAVPEGSTNATPGSATGNK